MLSYTRKDATLARRVRDHLKQELIVPWDYGDSPRTPTHYSPEIDDAIRRSSAMVVLLTAAWDQSQDCRYEAKQAAELSKRCVWLRCDETRPPWPVDDGDTLDFRPRQRSATLLQIARGRLSITTPTGWPDLTVRDHIR